jgi:hypothetical protein
MKEIYGLFARYLAILFLGSFNLSLFYFIFTPLTMYCLYFILSFFGDTIIFSNAILFNSYYLEFVDACIAGAAYYLLFILVFSIPKLSASRRIKMLLFCSLSFLIINLLRIFLMITLLGSSFFDKVHLFLWYFLSVGIVVFIWFTATKLFKIKSIPFYSDFLIIKKLKDSKTRKKNN